MNYLGIIGLWQTIVVVLVFGGIIMTIFALIDILKSEFSGNNKIVWTLVVLFLNLIGALLYFSIGKNQKIGIN